MAADPEPARRPAVPATSSTATAGASGAPQTALERLRARMEAQQATVQTRVGAPLPARPPISAPAGSMPRPSTLATPGTRPATGSLATAPAPRPAPGTPMPARSALPAPTRPPLTAPVRPPLRTPLTGAAPASGVPVRPPLRAPLSAPPGTPVSRPGTTPDRARGPVAPMPMPTLSEIEQTVDHAAYLAFSDAVKKLLGFDLTQYKRPQVWRRANSFAKQKGFANLIALCDACKADIDLRTELRDMITINVSEFFRNPEAWEQVRTAVLPDLLRLGRPIRMWSAGCSLGYEPYTWAMLVKEAGAGADTRILATDLDETILAQARASVYSDIQMVGVSPKRKSRFFESSDDRSVVKPELRGMVQWKRQDLLRDPFPSDLDIIACRNLVIYFTDEAKDGLYRRFAAALRPEGFLFIGATEAIADWRAFGLKMLSSGLYRKSGS